MACVLRPFQQYLKRPISLLSIIGKLMERCINNQLQHHLSVNNIITPFQSGFRTGDSTINQRLRLYHEFSKALDENKGWSFAI